MICEDCGFEHSDSKTCPRCGYDPTVDLIALVKIDSPCVSNPLDTEFSELCRKVDAGEIDASKAKERWQVINNMAREGNANARHLIAHVALAQKDYATAHKILARLADAGNPLAQLDLATIYENGLGIEKDPFDAIKLYRLAATKGNPLALFKLAEQHGGSGVLKPDIAFANRLMEELASTYPNMFTRKQNCQKAGCSCSGGLSDKEFASHAASQVSRLIKYAILAGIVIFLIWAVCSELN